MQRNPRCKHQCRSKKPNSSQKPFKCERFRCHHQRALHLVAAMNRCAPQIQTQLATNNKCRSSCSYRLTDTLDTVPFSGWAKPKLAGNNREQHSEDESNKTFHPHRANKEIWKCVHRWSTRSQRKVGEFLA